MRLWGNYSVVFWHAARLMINRLSLVVQWIINKMTINQVVIEIIYFRTECTVNALIFPPYQQHKNIGVPLDCQHTNYHVYAHSECHLWDHSQDSSRKEKEIPIYFSVTFLHFALWGSMLIMWIVLWNKISNKIWQILRSRKHPINPFIVVIITSANCPAWYTDCHQAFSSHPYP